RPTRGTPPHRREKAESDTDREQDHRDKTRSACDVPECRVRDERAHHDAPETMVADALDGATVTGVVVVGVVAEVPVEAELPVLVELAELLLVVDFELYEVAVDWPAVLVAALAVVPPAWAASPANRPVPVSAPAS